MLKLFFVHADLIVIVRAGECRDAADCRHFRRASRRFAGRCGALTDLLVSPLSNGVFASFGMSADRLCRDIDIPFPKASRWLRRRGRLTRI